MMKLASVATRKDRGRVFVYVDDDLAREARRALRLAGFNLSDPPGWKIPAPGTISVKPDDEGLKRCAELVRDALKGRGWKVAVI